MRTGETLRSPVNNETRRTKIMSMPPASRSMLGASLKAFFFFMLFLYAGFLLLSPQLGPSDEYAFLPTLQSGKFFPMYGEDFPYYNSTELGRFGPLGGQEYNIVALFSRSPAGYFALNAAEMLLFAVLFVWILRECSINRALIYFAGVVVLLVPGFTLSFFKLLYVEKNVLVLFSVFVASYLLFLKRPRTIYLVLALLSANAAIYYKEPVFIAIAVFAAGHLWLTWKTSSGKVKLLDGLLIGGAALYIGIYLITVMPNRGPSMYLPAAADNNILTLLKNVLNYALFSDPIPVLVLIPLLLWRLFRVFGGRDPAHPVLDPMAAAGVAYAGVFFALNMYGPYYLLPVYLFSLPPVLYFFQQGKLRGVFWTGILSVTALVLVSNAVPLAIHYVSYNKYVPVNFDKTMNFLVEDINRRYAGQRLNVFFDGVDRGTGLGVYFIAGEYLKFKGLPLTKFDFKSDIEARNPGPPVGKASPFDRPEDVDAVDPLRAYQYRQFPYSVYQPGSLPSIQRGDYLIVSPQSTRNIDGEYIEKLKRDHDLVFHTESAFSVPRFDLKTLLKHYLSRKLSSAQKAQGAMLNENMWSWPDYYVFVRK